MIGTAWEQLAKISIWNTSDNGYIDQTAILHPKC